MLHHSSFPTRARSASATVDALAAIRSCACFMDGTLLRVVAASALRLLLPAHSCHVNSANKQRAKMRRNPGRGICLVNFEMDLPGGLPQCHTSVSAEETSQALQVFLAW